MRNLSILASILAVSLVFASQALAVNGYVGGSLGVTIPQDSTLSDSLGEFATVKNDVGPMMTLFGGADFGFLRLEGEFGFLSSNVSSINAAPGVHFDSIYGPVTTINPDVNVSVFTGMMNAWFDFKNKSRVTPYIGGGIGFAYVYVGDTWGNDHYYDYNYYNDDTVFAWQVGGGVAIRLIPNLDLDLGYRYLAADNLNLNYFYWGPQDKTSFTSSNVTVGIRYTFR